MSNTIHEPGIITLPAIESVILLIRGQKVILDADLARLYGVPTKSLNRAVKRNRDRFPHEFMFQLTRREAEAMRCQIGTASARRNIRFRPSAFTEHGAMMAANVLNSPRAVRMSVAVIQTFIRLRQVLAEHSQLARQIAALERKYDSHDDAIQEIFHAIKALMRGARETRRKCEIGFHTGIAVAPQTKPARKCRAKSATSP